MRKTAVPARAAALTRDPAHARRAILLLVLALLAVALPRLAGAVPLLAAPVDLVAAGRTARVLVETRDERVVTVEWGAAPFATRVVRSAAGKHHAVELQGLEPGGVYVVRVRVGGVPVTPPRPFVMPGAPARVPAARQPLAL